MISQDLIPSNLTDQKRRGSKYGITVFRASLYLVIFLHFSILTLYLAPSNPVNHIFKVEIGSYVNPFFSQNWSLFAPDPVSSNQTLQIKFIAFNNEIESKTDWLDLKEMVHAERAKSFWSPLQRLEKYLSGVTQSIVTDQIHLNNFIETHSNFSQDSIRVLQDLYKMNYGHRSLKSYSQIVLSKLNFAKEYDSIAVMYRIVDAKFPRFSKRHLDYHDLNNYEITYFELDLGVIKYKDLEDDGRSSEN
ncbi:MAG: hypothetical protein KF763_14575 [Cyclobacteriaceae bacterium]|nr:hypothetical protein [Cyclobacteriaceae bacterium]